MKSLDWNQGSELGLIEKINRELLHPLGLALCRTPEDGKSPGMLISDDGEWTYDLPNTAPSDEQVREYVKRINLGELITKS